MKKIAASIYTLIVLTALCPAQTGLNRPGFIIAADKGPKTATTLNSILTRLGTSEATILVDGGTWTVGADVTFPTNTTLQVSRGSKLAVTAGMTLTLNCEFDAGFYDCFDGAGTITGSPSMLYRLVEWDMPALCGDGRLADDFVGTNTLTVMLTNAVYGWPNLDTDSTDDITGLVDAGGNGDLSNNLDGTWNVTFASPTGIVAVYTGSVPAGVIMAFPKSTPPDGGWLECNGASLSATNLNYTNLFDVIGYTYGGSALTYKLPDLRGMFLRGYNNGRTGTWCDEGVVGRSGRYDGAPILGDYVGSRQHDAFQDHIHYEQYALTTGSGIYPNYLAIPLGPLHATPHTETSEPVTGQWTTETRPKNTAVMFCIKY